MRVMRTLMIAAVIACAMTSLCFAEEEPTVEKAAVPEEAEVPPPPPPVEDQEMQTGEIPRRNDFSNPFVKVTAMIPDYLGKEIPAGEDVEMIVWFANNGPTPMNIHGIFAALQSSMDASRFIQNFTPRGLNLVVDSNTETSISYKFRPSEYLTAMPYRFFSLIEYSDNNNQRFFNILFNETLGFAEANVAFDVELIMTYLVIVGFFVGCGYLIYSCVAKKTNVKSKKASKKQEPESDENNEWLHGTSAHEHMKKQKRN